MPIKLQIMIMYIDQALRDRRVVVTHGFSIGLTTCCFVLEKGSLRTVGARLAAVFGTPLI